MEEYEVGGPALGRIHGANNDKKFFCHFTGFLEGIAASGDLEVGEVKPLIAEAKEFVIRVSDSDAFDIVEDFDSDLLEYDMIGDAVSVRIAVIDPNCEKSQLNRFLGFCRGIACDGVITETEAQTVLAFVTSFPDLRLVPGVRHIEVTCIDAIHDGIVTSEESEEICDAISQIVGDSYADTGLAQTAGVAAFDEYKFQDFSRELDGSNIVLTGTFKTSPRRVFEDELREFGVEVSRTVSGKTDFLIVGGEASRDWIEMHRGNKIRKAQELRKKAKKPNFVSELQVLRLLSNI